MATLPDVVKQSELLNQLVLNRSTMEELGRVEVLWMYPPAHRVLGFVCKSGFLGNKKSAFKLSQVEAIGTNGILTHSQPDPTDAEHVRQLESLIHCELWSNTGHKLGKIIDCVFSLKNGVIQDYLVVGDRFSPLTSGIYRLPPAKIMSLGRRRVLVSETALQEFSPYQEGIQQKLTKVSSALKEDYEQVTQDLRSLARRAQETTYEKTLRLKTIAEQAKERAQIIAEQAREKAHEISEQLTENVQTLAEQAKETSETLAERVQYTTQEWGEHLKDTTETFAAQAREAFEVDAEYPIDTRSSDLDDLDFLFEDETTSQEKVPPPPVQRQPETPAATEKPTPSSKYQGDVAAHAAKNTVSSSEEDPWDFGDRSTFANVSPENASNSTDGFEFDDSWNLDDDPWDITEPPTPTPEAALTLTVSTIAPDEPIQKVETTSNTTSVPCPENDNDDEDEPWL